VCSSLATTTSSHGTLYDVHRSLTVTPGQLHDTRAHRRRLSRGPAHQTPDPQYKSLSSVAGYSGWLSIGGLERCLG
jgi:hypothetical protein